MAFGVGPRAPSRGLSHARGANLASLILVDSRRLDQALEERANAHLNGLGAPGFPCGDRRWSARPPALLLCAGVESRQPWPESPLMSSLLTDRPETPATSFPTPPQVICSIGPSAPLSIHELAQHSARWWSEELVFLPLRLIMTECFRAKLRETRDGSKRGNSFLGCPQKLRAFCKIDCQCRFRRSRPGVPI
jgi:hypothetical protein